MNGARVLKDDLKVSTRVNDVVVMGWDGGGLRGAGWVDVCKYHEDTKRVPFFGYFPRALTPYKHCACVATVGSFCSI